MATIIKPTAGNSISGTTNEIDVSGGVVGIADNPVIPGNEGMTVPAGTTAQQPTSGAGGAIRFDTDTSQFMGDNGTAWAALGGGGGGGAMPFGVGTLVGTGGRYCAPIGSHGANTTIHTPDRICFWPYAIQTSRTFNRIGCEVTTADLGSETARLGIYENLSDTEFTPGALILDAGTVSVTSTGIKEIAISQELQGLIWVAIVINGNPTMRRFSSTARDIWYQTVGLESPDDTSDSNNSVYKNSQGAEHTALSDPAVTGLSVTTINAKAWVRTV